MQQNISQFLHTFLPVVIFSIIIILLIYTVHLVDYCTVQSNCMHVYYAVIINNNYVSFNKSLIITFTYLYNSMFLACFS